ncbi:hypothetical protein GW17_00017947 [Ensete ventricosum]|nr:hypothetical protein GW17_00017947 [Ensete ventricosum]
MSTAAAGVAAEGLSPLEAKAEAENAAYLSVALAENAIVILMLVEDHLRFQAQLFVSSRAADSIGSPASLTSSTISRTNSIGRGGSEPVDNIPSKRSSLSSDAGAIMERLTAAAAAEPYESVRCAFVSYGSCALDLLEGWKYRSRLWYGVGLPSKATAFGGGGSGWESWNAVLEKDLNGNWIELPLMKKSIAMLQALLLDESGIGGGLGIGGGSGTGMGGMTALYQLLDSDQPFLCMLRMVLAAMREDDNGEDDIFMRHISIKDGISEGLSYQSGNFMPFDSNNRLPARKPRSALLWRDWDHNNIQIGWAAVSMISPGWAAAFASPPAAMALAMIAAGAAGGEVIVTPIKSAPLRRDTSLFERRQTRLHTFSSFQKPPETANKSPPVPKDKAAAKAAALAAARDLERNAKIGSGRGLCAVAMATSAQRRSQSDSERAKRWNISEAMGAAWNECLQSVDSKTVSGRDFSALSYKYVAVLVGGFALARNMQRGEV